MTKIELEIHDDVVSVINKLKNINDTGLELYVPKGAVIFENILNLKLIKKWSEMKEKVISFDTEDEKGRAMLSNMEEEVFKSEEYLKEDVYESEYEEPAHKTVVGKKRQFPKMNFFKKKILLAIVIGVVILGGGIFALYKYASSKPVASIRIVVNSQLLARSLEIKVKNGAETDPEGKILKGYTVEAFVDDKLTIPATGEKIVGEKAQGTITIYNNTDEDKKFKEGTTIIYTDDDDKEFEYELKDDVEVKARQELTTDPENPDIVTYKKGSEEVEVVAKDIGNKYNIEEGEKLEVDDYKRTEFEAEVSEEIKGGKEEKIKVVKQEDIDELKKKLAENSEEKSIRALETKVTGNEKMIAGSVNVAVSKESFSHVLDEETNEVTLEQTFTAKGLVYKQEELNALIDELVEGFVPEGYVLSTRERSVNVEVLGNTQNTILSDQEADIQVTLRTYVVTDISEEIVKNDLMGKTVPEAEKYLGGVRNVKTYGLEVKPRIPFFDYIPNDLERILVTLERE